MKPETRTLLRVAVAAGEDERSSTSKTVDRLMGNRPEARFRFIQDNAAFVEELDI